MAGGIVDKDITRPGMFDGKAHMNDLNRLSDKDTDLVERCLATCLLYTSDAADE